MAKNYSVIGNVDIDFSVTVEADSPEEARQKARQIIEREMMTVTVNSRAVSIWEVEAEPE